MSDGDSTQPRRRRVQRACDVCRKRKMKCRPYASNKRTSEQPAGDGDSLKNESCSFCDEYHHECTYVGALQKGPTKEYVRELESKVDKLSKLLMHYMSEKEIDMALKGPSNGPKVASTSESLRKETSTTGIPASSSGTSSDGENQQYRKELLDEDVTYMQLAARMSRLSFDAPSFRFYGQAAGFGLVKAAVEVRHRFDSNIHQNLGHRLRPQYSTIQPWELETYAAERPARTPYVFPEDTILRQLVGLYFAQENMILPVLHRQIFERDLDAHLHETDMIFGGVVMLMCAIAARLCNAASLRLLGYEDNAASLSIGWKYFSQVPFLDRKAITFPDYRVVQFCALYAYFMGGTSLPQVPWNVIGTGLRIAQELGGHRRKYGKGEVPTVEDELLKRAFWSLYFLDREGSATLGRPCGLADQDIDAEFPVGCDDEYWQCADPSQDFKQPVGKPSYRTYWTCRLQLTLLHSSCMKRIYATAKAKIDLGIAEQEKQQQIVSELDSALNAWVDSIPEELRWDPNRRDETLFNQSATLYIAYYYLQILIHRPFIPGPGRKSALSFPSLSICTNAARCASHVIETVTTRGWPNSLSGMSAFACAIVLVLGLWGGQPPNASVLNTKGLEDIYRCMDYLQWLEERWHYCGRLWDVLHGLVLVGELPIPDVERQSAMAMKRRRDEDEFERKSVAPGRATSQRSSAHSEASINTEGETSQGRRYFQRIIPKVSASALPLHSDDLGRLSFDERSGLGEAAFALQDEILETEGQQQHWFHGQGELSAGMGYQMSFQAQDNVFDEAHHRQRPGASALNPAYGGSGECRPTGNVVSDSQQTVRTTRLWDTAPSGFGIHDWNAYISTANNERRSSSTQQYENQWSNGGAG